MALKWLKISKKQAFELSPHKGLLVRLKFVKMQSYSMLPLIISGSKANRCNQSNEVGV